MASLLNGFFEKNSAEYAEAQLRRDALDKYWDHGIAGELKRYLPSYKIFTVTPLEEDVKPHAYITSTALYAFTKKETYMPGRIEDQELQVPDASKPLGFWVLLTKSFNEDEFNIVNNYAMNHKLDLGIDGGLYMSTSPVQSRELRLSQLPDISLDAN